MSRRSRDKEWNRFAVPAYGEWLGGRFALPVFVADREQPYRPEAVLWMEANGTIVAQAMLAPEQAEGAIARVLIRAFESPSIGPPRQPKRIRLADAALAAEVRVELRARKIRIPVAVAPTPELDALLDDLIASLSRGGAEASYLEGGRVSAPALRELFVAAELLYRVAPWKVATDDQVLRMDIPALGVEGACVCIIGNLGQSLGLVIFPSLEGYEAFAAASDEPLDRRGRVDLGCDHLVLGFERGDGLPEQMRREVSEHGWPVASPDAYPVVERCERDGASRPLVERDVKIAAACATSLLAFFARHRDLFAAEEYEPVCESYFDDRELEVRFTLPYEAFPIFDVEDAPRRQMAAVPTPARPKVGRNAPCPCGSGRKYKKCHLPIEEAARGAAPSSAPIHDLDGELVRKLGGFAIRRFGVEWQRFVNSRERADALRERVEAACGDLLRHRAREHSDPLSSSSADRAPRTRLLEAPPAGAEQLLLDFKRRHYADWPDRALPALGGLSPREAMQTARGRGAVDVLLKDMEHRERRSSGAAPFDFAPLRRELGFE